MGLRPGRRLEISSHFIPLPRSSMIRASSSGDHLLCFLAGESELCGGMVRLAPGADPTATVGAPSRAVCGSGGPGAGAVVAA